MRYLTTYGIPDMIPRSGKISYSVLAKMCHVDVAQLKQNLRFAISFKFFSEPDPVHVEHNDASRMLIEGSPQRPFTQWLTGDCAPMIAHQLDALEKWGHGSQEPNETAVNAAYGSTGDFYQFVAADPVRDKRFGAAIQMSSAVTQSALENIKMGFPWQDIGHGTIVDVGGHLGHTAVAIAEAAPDAQIIIQDRPEVVSLAQEPSTTVIPASLNERVKFESHDFFTVQKTPGDVFFYRKTLLNYTDKYAAKMIQALSPILKPGNRLVIMDFVLSEKPIATHTQERYYRAVDLQMRIYYNCKYRSLDEWKALVSSSEPRLKFEAIRTPPTGGLAVVSFIYE
jgi:ubiquinone/menaquinone biosynthesis C-methylase UbiE